MNAQQIKSELNKYVNKFSMLNFEMGKLRSTFNDGSEYLYLNTQELKLRKLFKTFLENNIKDSDSSTDN